MLKSRIFYKTCPVCNANAIQAVMQAKDYTVSQEKFDIWECQACKTRFTQGIPEASSIGAYYQSEEYVSHSNTSKGVINQMYQIVRGITLKQKRKIVQKASGLETGQLLDIGCGTGEFLHTMKEANWQVEGLEPDEHARQFGMDQYGLSVSESSHLFSLEEHTFDVISMWHVLEHVHDLHAYLDHIYKILKPSGTLLIAVPNYQAKDAEYYEEEWAAYDVPRHLYHFAPSSIKTLLKAHHFEFKSLQAMPFDGFYVSLLSEKYRHGNTRLISGGWQGLKSYLSAASNPEKGSAVLYTAKKA